ncbi:ABC transporter permease [Muricauda sp. CAU 1633]|uniref:ABC transporter permease n=1 Tax=Allomuricauda sp. CAU 1633 TaxID=2816036 RepID=UPI001A8EA160|nr:ABC transporter permease [Muricauda sp. CAU 1633]MBO0322842.1 ABC transporter permease [Muricauda sp. CAU 1633]
MFDRDIWQEIFHSIKNNKLRTFLTGFSVAWAIFILVLLLGSVNGMKNGFTGQFADDANNSIIIRTGSTSKAYAGFEADRRIQLRNDDVEYISKSFPKDVEYITPVMFKGATTRYKSETGSYSLRGVNPNYLLIDKTRLTEGRYINDNDLYKSSKVAVVGKKIVEDLYKKDSVLGSFLEINGLPYKVIGVFEEEGRDDNAERTIYAPVTTMQRIYGQTDEINQISLTYNPNFDLTQALSFSERLENLLKRRHKVDPDDQAAVRVFNYAQIFSDISNFTTGLSTMSIIVGALILLAGVVAIGNIMVFIIKERTKEIGVRKALGAEPWQIIKLVLLESIFTTVLAGFFGMLFASLILGIIGPNIDTPAFANPSVSISTVVTATIILVVAGVLAGLIPSIKAANVKPIVALSDK